MSVQNDQALSRALSRRSRIAHLKKRVGEALFHTYGFLGYLFLYFPIIILVVFSFNDSRSTAQWAGFTTHWYVDMIHDRQIILSLWNSLFVAVVSTSISVVIGTLAALAMERYRFWGKLMMDAVLYLPIIIPDIAMAIMLLIFFDVSGIGFEPWKVNIFGVHLAVPYSVIIGHVAFNISFVAIVVRARLAQMDKVLEEAAQDLYADPWRNILAGDVPHAASGHHGRRAAGFYPFHGRFRHHVLHQRRGLQHPACAGVQHDQERRDAENQRGVQPDVAFLVGFGGNFSHLEQER